MKTTIKYLIIACLATIVCTANTFGQRKITVVGTATTFDYGDKMANTRGDGSLAESRVSQRALAAFTKSFPGATDAKWFRAGKMYGVNFVESEKPHKSLYNVKGNLIYSLCFGSEKDLPRDVRKTVKTEYIDCNITQAVEVHENDRHVWLVNLDDANNLITAGVEDGSIAELSRYAKAK